MVSFVSTLSDHQNKPCPEQVFNFFPFPPAMSLAFDRAKGSTFPLLADVYRVLPSHALSLLVTEDISCGVTGVQTSKLQPAKR